MREMNQTEWRTWIEENYEVEECTFRQFTAVKDLEQSEDVLYVYPNPFFQELKKLELPISYVNYIIVQSPGGRRTETIQAEVFLLGRRLYLHTCADTDATKRTFETYQSSHIRNFYSAQESIESIYRIMKEFLYEHGYGRLDFQLYEYEEKAI